MKNILIIMQFFGKQQKFHHPDILKNGLKLLLKKCFLNWKRKLLQLLYQQLKKKTKTLNDYELSVKKAAENAGPNYKKFLKLDDEGKKKWIEDKIEAIKKSSETDKKIKNQWNKYDNPSRGTSRCPIIWKPTLKNTDNIDIEGRYIYIHNDISSQHSCKQLHFSHNYKDFAKEIISSFPSYPNGCLDHLKYIYVYTTDKDLFSLQIIHITFGFDNEFEDQLSKSVQRFGDFMTREYDSGRYMGD